MKKISLIFKETSENRIKNNLKESCSVIIIKHQGLSSPNLSTLRLALKNAKADLLVVKNNIVKRALKNSDLADFIKSIEGPCGLVFVKDEPIDTCRVLYDFSREHENLKLAGGFLRDRVLDKNDIETLAKLPSKEALRAQVVMTLNSPIVKLAVVLNQTLRKFVYCLEQIKQKKNTNTPRL